MPRRPVRWVGNTFEAQAFPAVVGTSLDYVVVDADDGGPSLFSFEHMTSPTIVRCLGVIYTQLNADTTDPDATYANRYQIGLICSDEDKPPENPASELGHPWLWMDYGFLHRPSIGAKVSGAESGSPGVIVSADSTQHPYGTAIIRHEFDVRAMRKVARDCELRLVIRLRSDTGNTSPVMHGFVRALIKE